MTDTLTALAGPKDAASTSTDMADREFAARRRLDPSLVGGDRPAALGARLPARLPPDRQPARRRGPHPRRLHPGLPVAELLHARHLRGLAAPDHDQRLPRQDAAQAAHPLRRPPGGRRQPDGQPRARDRRRPSTTPTSTTTSSARWTRCRRTSGRPSSSATSRACPTRRSPRPWASSSGPCAPASTEAARSCARRSPTVLRSVRWFRRPPRPVPRSVPPGCCRGRADRDVHVTSVCRSARTSTVGSTRGRSMPSTSTSRYAWSAGTRPMRSGGC